MGVLNFFKKKEVGKNESNRDLVSEWIERGKKIIYPERYEAWEKFVYRASEGKYFGLEIEGILTIMNELELGNELDKVVENISDDPIAKDYMRSDIRNRVFEFSKRGPEFFEYVLEENMLNETLKRTIEEKKQENIELEKLHCKK